MRKIIIAAALLVMLGFVACNYNGPNEAPTMFDMDTTSVGSLPQAPKEGDSSTAVMPENPAAASDTVHAESAGHNAH